MSFSAAIRAALDFAFAEFALQRGEEAAGLEFELSWVTESVEEAALKSDGLVAGFCLSPNLASQ
jgi:hypothetical protein